MPIKYGSDVAITRSTLERIVHDVCADPTSNAVKAWSKMVQQFRVEDARLEPMVTVVANDNWIEFTIRYIVDYKSRRGTKDQLFTRILEAVDASGGKMGMASATFHLVEAPTIQVQLKHS